MNASNAAAEPESSAAFPAAVDAPAGTAGLLSFKALNRGEPIEKTFRCLPHWEQAGCTYFITYRLADAMPAEKRRQWQAELDDWLALHPQPWDDATWREYTRTFEGEIQRWLDAGHGSCALKDPAIRRIVSDSFHHFDGQRYRLGDYVIMPNHVHVLFTPLPGHGMKELVTAWKRFTGHAILTKTGHPPPFWQLESYDHIVRSGRQLAHYQNYIRENPAKAHLNPNQWTHYEAESSPAVPAGANNNAAGTAALHSSASFLCLILLFLTLLPAPAQTDFARPAESSAFLTDTRQSATTSSARSTALLVDTRAMEPVRVFAETSPPSFTVDTRAGVPGPLTVAGLVSTNAGQALGGVSIEIKIFGQVWWQGLSGPDGSFFPPEMKAQDYTIVARKSGYLTYGQNVAGVAGGLRSLPLTMVPLSPAPVTQPVSRIVPDTEKTDPGTLVLPAVPGQPERQLKLYHSGRWYAVGELFGPVVNPNAMSIVLSHGWLKSANDWPLNMALLISQNNTLGTPPNIFAWDWKDAADSVALWPDRATKQGIALGQALRRQLGYEYAKRVHFIGHSMGTIVNRFACDTVHQAGTSEAGELRWDAALTLPHLTLLDEAELSSFLGTRVITSATIGAITAGWAGALKEAAVTAYQDWKSPIPATPTSLIDSYISMVGIQRPQAVNICLTAPAVGFMNPIDAHAYAHEWYRNTAQSPFSPVLGFKQSREGGGILPSSAAGLGKASLWYENLDTPHPLDLVREPAPTALEANLFILGAYSIRAGATIGDPILATADAVSNKVLGGYAAGLKWAGDIGGTIIIKGQQAYTTVSEKLGNGWDAFTDKGGQVLDRLNPQRLFDKVSSPTFQIHIGGGSAPSAFRNARNGPATTTEPAAWVTLTIPETAGFMQFDFKVTGPPGDDCVAAAVGGKNVFNLPAKILLSGEMQSTDLIDVSAYAGQTVELYFGLTGGTSTTCELVVDGLRFITIPYPTLALENHGATVSLHWPAAASGWRLEASETMAADSWQGVEPPTPESFTMTNGVNRMEEPRSSEKQYYRLRRTE